ncbi:ankyrin repeat domain-containing protein [Pseudorhodoferax sp.]|uniref:ankyrin repeat domain-containing protein n=1 Tax=Pseudorhodoferax sp. TaxID=1993553 RepID=UPI0039E300EA
MKRMPLRPDLGHLKKQAKQLAAEARAGTPAALARLRGHLPAAAGHDDAALAAMDWRLHDAQSCLAREYGFASWAELAGFVAARRALADDPAQAQRHWLGLVYAGDLTGSLDGAQPAVAARLLAAQPGLAAGDPLLACAVGDLAAVEAAIARDAGWVHRPGGPLQLPPLLAVTHSSLLRLPAFRAGLHACAQRLLAAGADPGQQVGSRWPPASLQAPSATERLSALYGAAGQNHDAALTRLLLAAGADPNDGESLYHALEHPECTRLLLEAGARVTGTNALYRVLDLDALPQLELLLAHGADPNEPAAGPPTSDWGRPLLWAIRRRRSAAHVAALLRAGADPRARTPDGTDAATLALRHGLPEVAALLAAAGLLPPSAAQAPDELFVAACARGDEAEARCLQARHPDWPAALAPAQLRLLPELAATGCLDGVRCMLRLGWPVATPGGDWQASALNHAVFRGDAEMARLLLAHGAQWTERHGFGDDCSGTLSWASVNRPDGPGDWLGCAQALVAHGMPGARPDPQAADTVLLDGRRKRFSDEVTDFLLDAGTPRQPA